MKVRKIRFEVERTFPLEQFGNIKPRIVIEGEVETPEEQNQFCLDAQDFALAQLFIFKKSIKK